MLIKLTALIAAVALAVPQPVEELDTAAYLGRWYQTHASRTVKYTFELGGNCVTADYGSTDYDDVISVTNTVRWKFLRKWRWIRKLFTRFTKVKGFAAQSDETAGALSVSIGPTSEDNPALVEFKDPGNYWIVALGETNDDGLYKWSVVSDPKQRSLYILVRDVEDFRANDQDDVLDMVKDMGFTNFLNKPLSTNQDDCDY